MTQYLLDTDICVELLRHNERVITGIETAGRENCFVSEITIAELFYGAAKSGREENFDDVQRIQDLFEVVPLRPSLRKYGVTKAHLMAKGISVGEFDLLVGSCAVHNNMTMVTSNLKHFAHIPDIQLEDWAQKSKHKSQNIQKKNRLQ